MGKLDRSPVMLGLLVYGLLTLTGAKVASATATATAPAPAPAPAPTTATATATRRVVVQCKPQARANCQELFTSFSGRMHYDFELFDVFAVTLNEADIQTIKQSVSIQSIHDDVPRYTLTQQHGSPREETQQQTRNYGVEMVQAPQAWNTGATGQGVTVCVVDTGVDATHPDLINRTAGIAPPSSSSLDGSVDTIGHGTHIAGILGAVAPSAHLLSVKVFPDSGGYAYSSDIAAAALACAKEGASILSMSLGGSRPSAFESRVLHSLLAHRDVISVAAASKTDNGYGSFPASYPSVISVTAVDDKNKLPRFAPFDKHIKVAAPGQNIWSTLPLTDPCVICRAIGAYQYGTLSGTSMAVPHVSGVLAILWSFQPEATASEVIEAIQTSSDVSGLVQALAAIEFMRGGFTLGTSANEGMHIAPSSSCAYGNVLLQLQVTTTITQNAFWEVRRISNGDLQVSSEGNQGSTEQCVPDECYLFSFSNGIFDLTLDGHAKIENEKVLNDQVDRIIGRDCNDSQPSDTRAPKAQAEISSAPSVQEDGRCKTVGHVPVELVIRTDSHPEETTIQLQGLADKDVLWKYSNLQPRREFVFDACVDGSSCYELSIWDSGGDGLCCSYGLGGYQIFYDDKEVQKGAMFKNLVTVELGDCIGTAL